MTFLFRKNWLVAMALCAFCIQIPFAFAAPSSDIDKLYLQAKELVEQEKSAEALPLLEQVVKAQPGNAMAHYLLGFSLVVSAQDIPDEARRKVQRVRARNAWIRAKQLNVRQPNVDALIASIPADGSPVPGLEPLSENAEANLLMTAAEEFYTSGKLDEALANYQKALALDPKIYEAALFSGDVYLHRKDYANAEKWYQKAIAIDPDRETAYRYSATPLMRQGKTDEALARYIEAHIAEPYNRFTIGGLNQWAQLTENELHDPGISIPVKVTTDNTGAPKITLDSKAIAKGTSDGTSAWATYGLERVAWRKQKFAAAFPKEKTYRHSLAEETAALRAVLDVAGEMKGVTQLDPDLARLKKLNDEGLLEAFVLLTLSDEGIARDHQEYLQKHRASLRKFVTDYVINGG